MAIPKDFLAGRAVVVVEDDTFSMDIALRILQHHGANVHTAVNGQDGLALIERILPDFVITDLSMPIMDGWTMIATLKQNPAIAHIPVIALTAHAMTSDRDRALALGANSYMVKPFTPSSFKEHLIDILDKIPGMEVSR